MEIKPDKTKAMRIGRMPRREMRIIRLKDKPIEQVKGFKYPDENRIIGNGIKERVNSAGKILYAVILASEMRFLRKI